MERWQTIAKLPVLFSIEMIKYYKTYERVDSCHSDFLEAPREASMVVEQHLMKLFLVGRYLGFILYS